MSIKGPQLALLVWLGNLVILAGGGMAGYKIWQEITEERKVAYKRAGEPDVRQGSVEWQRVTATAKPEDVATFRGSALSPRPRPRPPVERDPTPPVEVEKPEPTDDELRAEVAAWIAELFQLRMVYGSGRAIVTLQRGGNPTLHLRPDMSFKTEFANSTNNELAALGREDITVVRIIPDIDPDGSPGAHVLFKAPSRNADYKDRMFEVPLTMSSDYFKRVNPSSLGRQVSSPTGRTPTVQRPPQDRSGPTVEQPPVQTAPRESSYDENTGTWTLGTDDYMHVDVDELARHAIVRYDREGRPLGIEIGESLPENSLVAQRGGRRGDIIKSINGTPVRGMSDVRRVVREQYNQGTEEFVVILERDGQEMRKIFRAPRN
jgi:hypothetical protein